MSEESIDELFSKAIALRNNKKRDEAIEVCHRIIQLYSTDPYIATTYLVLGGLYRDKKQYQNAYIYLSKASSLSPSSELISLAVYLTLVDLEKYEEAIAELKRYLDVYPAKRYKTTLKELLGDLKDGYATDYKEIILSLASRHGVELYQK